MSEFLHSELVTVTRECSFDASEFMVAELRRAAFGALARLEVGFGALAAISTLIHARCNFRA